MSLLEVARDTLKEIPMADVLRERLSLALDQSAGFERQVAELQSKVGGLEVMLEREASAHRQLQGELQRLKDEHAEEVRILHAVEFRRGTRTAGVWMGFCPKCHMPAQNAAIPKPYSHNWNKVISCTGNCGWKVFADKKLEDIVGEMTKGGGGESKLT